MKMWRTRGFVLVSVIFINLVLAVDASFADDDSTPSEDPMSSIVMIAAILDELASGTSTVEPGDSDEVDNDADSDGVSDGSDQCPGTPPGDEVDSSGCALSQLDSDDDGIADDVDQCPETAPGAVVDESGCEDNSESVRETYEINVNPLIVSSQGGCTSGGCHGRANAPGGLRLYSSSESDNAQLNYDSLVSYIDRRAGNSLLAKIAGNSGHGGGVRYASGTDEYKVIEDWVRSVEALP